MESLQVRLAMKCSRAALHCLCGAATQQAYHIERPLPSLLLLLFDANVLTYLCTTLCLLRPPPPPCRHPGQVQPVVARGRQPAGAGVHKVRAQHLQLTAHTGKRGGSSQAVTGQPAGEGRLRQQQQQHYSRTAAARHAPLHTACNL
jgi:hypothetical protein